MIDKRILKFEHRDETYTALYCPSERFEQDYILISTPNLKLKCPVPKSNTEEAFLQSLKSRIDKHYKIGQYSEEAKQKQREKSKST